MSVDFRGSGSVEDKGILLIDGSYGEGGGQIIRNAVILACLLRRKIEVINIRANRPNPGLASQHLESIRAMSRISGATTTKELKKQDTQFDLNGTTIVRPAHGVETTIDLVTAGSITLCIQCILPYLMCLKSPSKVRIIGGTHVMKSPSFDYLKRIFIPTFNTFIGNNVEAMLQKPGYFPRGGGSVELVVNPIQGNFLPVNLTERGQLCKIEAILNVTEKMKSHIAHYRNMISVDTRNIEVRIVSFASVEYFVSFEKSNAGFSHMVEGRNPQANEVFHAIEVVQNQMKTFLNSTATVDGYLQDQLIIYMSLAKLSDPSSQNKIRTLKPSDHTMSAIHVCQNFDLENVFEISKNGDDSFDIAL